MLIKTSLISKEFIEEDEKECKGCGLIKKRSEFYINRLMKDGLQSKCKGCMKDQCANKPQYPRSTKDTKCTMCNLTKPAEEFYTDLKRKNGLTTRCKKCIREYELEVKIREKKIPEEKRCLRCGTVKPASEFYKTNSKANGLYSHCKKCIEKYRKTRLAIKDTEATKGTENRDIKRIESWNEAESVFREITETQLVVVAEEKACKNRVAMIIQQSSEVIAPHKRHQACLRQLLEQYLKNIWLRGDSLQKDFRFGTVTRKGRRFSYNLNLELARERLELP